MVDKADSQLIRLGRIAGAYGVRGWLHVASDTDPVEGILNYRPWRVHLGGDWVAVDVAEGRRHQHGVVVRISGCDDRSAAQSYIGAEIAVPRTELPALDEGNYYWADLIGADVLTREGVTLGRVDHLMQTGANDVLVVMGERELLIPFIEDDVVLSVDLGGGCITVDWDPEF